MQRKYRRPFSHSPSLHYLAYSTLLPVIKLIHIRNILLHFSAHLGGACSLVWTLTSIWLGRTLSENIHQIQRREACSMLDLSYCY